MLFVNFVAEVNLIEMAMNKNCIGRYYVDGLPLWLAWHCCGA